MDHTPSQPEQPDETSFLEGIVNLTVIVGALGYFVDIFDLILFPIVRRSLTDLGVHRTRSSPPSSTYSISR